MYSCPKWPDSRFLQWTLSKYSLHKMVRVSQAVLQQSVLVCSWFFSFAHPSLYLSNILPIITYLARQIPLLSLGRGRHICSFWVPSIIHPSIADGPISHPNFTAVLASVCTGHMAAGTRISFYNWKHALLFFAIGVDGYCHRPLHLYFCAAGRLAICPSRTTITALIP